MQTERTFGAEIEKPVSDIDSGKPKGLSQEFFKRIAQIYSGSNFNFKYSDIQPETILGVHIPPIGEIGLDNGFNLQETSSRVTSNLEELKKLLTQDLVIVQEALAAEGATVINLSIHPLAATDNETYRAFVAPKGVYKYITARGWDHKVGIDAKAHNSPCTGVRPHEAAKAVTTIIGAGAAIIGFFANSPFAEGKISGFKESRCTIWERMFRNSYSPGDLKTARFPEKPFITLKDYFIWMFGPGTNIHFVMASGRNYKTFGDGAIIIEGNPSVLSYLILPQAKGHFFNDARDVIVIPHLSHLEAMQFAQFTGARLRWQFNHEKINKLTFLEALKKDCLEQIFDNGGINYLYIEGRDAGANFPDQELQDVAPEIAFSTFMAPSALQKGLIQNLEEAYAYIMNYPWEQLKLLRDAAIKDGLEAQSGGLTVYQFARDLLDIAARGLTLEEQRLLAYPEYVLRTGKNGADRALAAYNSGRSIQQIVKLRNVLL